MSNFKLLKSEETQNTIAKTFKHNKNYCPLPSLPYANCCVELINEQNAFILWSYNTRVFAYLPEKDVIILPLRFYSTTTKKHIKAFVKDYIPNFSTSFVEELINLGYTSYSIKTGQLNEYDTGYID